GRGNSLLEDSLLTVSGPFVRTVAGGAGSLVGLWNSYLDLRGAREESVVLRSKLARLGEEAREGEEFRRENLRLRELLDLKPSQEVPSLAAEVLAVGSAGQARTALISRGSRDGVK